MLLKLIIKNFAIAKNLELNFEKGFNALTGESGAGKSLIIESLNFVLGGKIKKSKILNDDETTTVQAVFEISDIDSLEEIKTLPLFEEEKPELIILTRKLYKTGRNIYYINGEIVS